MITVEVAYAKPEEQLILSLEVAEGTLVSDAIEQSGILSHFPEIDIETSKLGIFSKACTGKTVLRAYDRIEIYRALIADPKEVRKRRAAEGKKMNKGGGAEKK